MWLRDTNLFEDAWNRKIKGKNVYRINDDKLFLKNHSKSFSLYFSPEVREQVLHTHTRKRKHIHKHKHTKQQAKWHVCVAYFNFKNLGSSNENTEFLTQILRQFPAVTCTSFMNAFSFISVNCRRIYYIDFSNTAVTRNEKSLVVVSTNSLTSFLTSNS
jgi:hypothetical protein